MTNVGANDERWASRRSCLGQILDNGKRGRADRIAPDLTQRRARLPLLSGYSLLYRLRDLAAATCLRMSQMPIDPLLHGWIFGHTILLVPGLIGFPHRVPPFLRDVSHKILYRPRAYLVVSKTGKNTSMLALASYAARVEMRPTLDISPASHRRVWAGDIKCEAIR